MSRKLWNKTQLDAFFGVNRSTTYTWIMRGMPCRKKGDDERGYEFDPLEVLEWYFTHKQPAPPDDPETLKAKERLDWYRGARERDRHLEEASQLIPRKKHETMLETAVEFLADALESLPDRLAHQHNLEGATAQRTKAAVDRLRKDLYRGLDEG